MKELLLVHFAWYVKSKSTISCFKDEEVKVGNVIDKILINNNTHYVVLIPDTKEHYIVNPLNVTKIRRLTVK